MSVKCHPQQTIIILHRFSWSPHTNTTMTKDHVHVYNVCSCGNMAPIDLSDTSGYDGDGGHGDNDGFLGKTEAQNVGKALVSVAISEKQVDLRKQYDEDSQSVGGGLETMSASLDALSSDIKELGRCVKSTAIAAQLLQRVQERVNKEIRGALNSEQSKMTIKDKQITTLNRKLKKIERNQRSLIFGYKAYQALRWIVILLLLALVVLAIVTSIQMGTGNCEEKGYPSGFKQLPNSTCVDSCPQGTWSTMDSRCKLCHSNCVTCTSETKCLSCAIGFTLQEGSEKCIRDYSPSPSPSALNCSCPNGI